MKRRHDPRCSRRQASISTKTVRRAAIDGRRCDRRDDRRRSARRHRAISPCQGEDRLRLGDCEIARIGGAALESGRADLPGDAAEPCCFGVGAGQHRDDAGNVIGGGCIHADKLSARDQREQDHGVELVSLLDEDQRDEAPSASSPAACPRRRKMPLAQVHADRCSAPSRPIAMAGALAGHQFTMKLKDAPAEA